MATILSRDRLAEMLIQQGRLSPLDCDRLCQIQKETRKLFLDVMIEEKILDEKSMLHFLSDAFNIPIFRLQSYKIDPEALKLVPREMAEKLHAIPIARVGSYLTLATSRPLDLIVLDDLKGITGCQVKQVLVTSSEIHDAMTSNYTGPAILKQFAKGKDSSEVELILQKEEAVDAEAIDQAPIVRMVNKIVEDAVTMRASDIHLEAYQDHFRIRYRIDGSLKESFRHSLDIYSAVIARIKILSNLDITEKRVPQDGRFKIKLGEKEIDFRVSILPTFFGEKGVLRLLDKKNVRSGLDDLGFSKRPIEILKDAIKRPYGMVLVTGPTGSGKSTTLYSVLNLLNTPEKNLMTIEDPIEYQVEGITQTQVNPEIGLTFASGLRSLLRQSPDVILVGEIRDTETADISVKAALTGHLVLSTLHTNSAAGTITRLIDMGVEPFLVASSVVVVAAQRLLRRICNDCKSESKLPPEVLKRLSDATPIKGVTAFKGKGCERCNLTGYFGRLSAIEVFPLDSEIREAILKRASPEMIEKMARKKGMETLFDNALTLFKEGKTTLEEVLRVTAKTTD